MRHDSQKYVFEFSFSVLFLTRYRSCQVVAFSFRWAEYIMRAHGQLVSSCIVMRSDLKRNEIGPSLGTFWVRHWLIFLSSKATAFIYLVGSKERPPQSRPISSPQSKTNHFEFNSVSVVYLWTFSWSYISLRSQGKIGNLHQAVPKSSMTMPNFSSLFSNEKITSSA